MTKFNDYLRELLSNETERAEYINAALEDFLIDHNKELFLAAIRNVIEVSGGITEVSKKADLNRQHLYRMLSPSGNPSFNNIGLLLSVLGLKLRVEERASR